MARVFTINFDFRGSRHAAIVSTWKDGEQAGHVQVTVTDEALHHLIPDGKLSFRAGEVMLEEHGASAYTELRYCIHQALTGHLQRIPV